MSREQRSRSRETTFDNPAMQDFPLETEDRYRPYSSSQNYPSSSRPHYYHQPGSREPPTPPSRQQRPTTSSRNSEASSSLTPIPTVDAAVRPPLPRPSSERSDHPSEAIKFEANEGFFLSYWKTFWIVLAAVFLIISVGLLVGFLTRRASGQVAANVTVVTEQPTLDPAVAWHAQRLPENIETIRYDLDLRIDKDQGVLSGAVSITFKCTEETDLILVHASRLEITASQVSLTSRATRIELPIKNQFIFEQRQYYVIELEENLSEDAEYVLRFAEFTGLIKPDLSGLYLSPYKTRSGFERTMVASLFEPSFARKVFPCFDEPSFKAVFKVSVTHPRFNFDTVLFNTDVERSEDADTGWIRETFQETPIMSTYLIGIVVGDLRSIERETQKGRMIRVWARPEVIHQMNLLLDFAEKSYEFFDGYFTGIEDPAPKTDLVAVPTFLFAAVENWGLITFLERLVLYDENKSGIKRRHQIEEVTAHEIAHSWFGNLVSLKWWSDLWLKEGFATYFSIEAMAAMEPHSDAFAISVADIVQRALDVDSYANSHPLTVPGVEDIDIIVSNYDVITYYKGIAIVRMLKMMLGDDAFKSGLRSYLRRYEFGNADADDLWAEFTRVAADDIDVKEVMDTWILQQGYPVLTVTRQSPLSRQISVDQSLFQVKHDDVNFDLSTGEFGYKWYIKFKYNSHDNIPVKETWMNKENIEISIPSQPQGQWIHGNVELSSFLRVNYDLNNWNMITEQLMTDHKVFSEASRAAIVDDAFNLQRAGLLDTETTLKVTMYLSEEDSYLPWKAASRGFEYLCNRLFLTDYYGRFERYILRLLDDKFTELGFISTASESAQTRYLRTLMVRMACDHGDVTCTDGAMQYFITWLQNVNNQIPVDVKADVYGVGVANSDSDQWQILWEMLNDNLLIDDEVAIREALTKSREPWVLNRYMTWSLNASIVPAGEDMYVIMRVSKTPTGHALAIDFIIDHFDQLLQIAVDNIAIFQGAMQSAKTVNRKSQLRQFESLRSKLPSHGGIKKTFDDAVQTMKRNIDWLEKYQNHVLRFLDENVPNV